MNYILHLNSWKECSFVSQVSPTESASSRISSTDIKEFYYDDELNCPELAMEKHLRLQSTADFDSSENIVTTSTPPRLCPSFNFPSGGCSGSEGDGRMGKTSGTSNKLAKNMQVTLRDSGTETDGKTRGRVIGSFWQGRNTRLSCAFFRSVDVKLIGFELKP